MDERKKARSRAGLRAKVTSRKQAIAIGCRRRARKASRPARKVARRSACEESRGQEGGTQTTEVVLTAAVEACFVHRGCAGSDGAPTLARKDERSPALPCVSRRHVARGSNHQPEGKGIRTWHSMTTDAAQRAARQPWQQAIRGGRLLERPAEPVRPGRQQQGENWRDAGMSRGGSPGGPGQLRWQA